MRRERKMRFIVDIGSNHVTNDVPSKSRALELIHAAAESGATDVKFQLFDKLYRDSSQQKNISKIALPKNWIDELRNKCDELGVNFLCTPFSLNAVDYLETFVKEWKIASWDITFEPMIKKIGKSGKPVIMSTGGATSKEIKTAVKWLYGDKMVKKANYIKDHPYAPSLHGRLSYCSSRYATKQNY